MSFTIPNVKTVLELNTFQSEPMPQEIMITDLKKSIAKVTGKIHPLSLKQFVRGMEDIGAIKVHGDIVKILIHTDEL